MKNTNAFIKLTSLVVAVFLFFASSCKKENNGTVSVPILTTTAVTDITQTTANSGGNITSDAGLFITARGVCWSTNQTPTISDNKTTDGTGVGEFVSMLSGLTPNTTYYVRAYATNSMGTGYGNTVSFTTQQQGSTSIPVLSTTAVTDITQTTANSGGNITSDGGYAVTARGVCWSTSQTPTISDNKTTDGTGVGEFTSELSGLTPNTMYYVRAYATNSVGTAYGDAISFTTQQEEGVNTFSDPRDGNIYEFVTIGEQIWMAENLRYLPSVVGPATGSSEVPLYYVFGYDGTDVEEAKATENYITYGVLYNWPAAMNGETGSNTNPSGVQGLCPCGWHLPSDDEWKQLEMHLGMTEAQVNRTGWRGSDEGGKIKDASPEYWISPNVAATNETGFTALPAGYRDHDGVFRDLGITAVWWCATENGDVDAWSRYVYYGKGGIYRDNYHRHVGRSIRCVKD